MKTAIQTSPSLNSYISQHDDIRPIAFSLNNNNNNINENNNSSSSINNSVGILNINSSGLNNNNINNNNSLQIQNNSNTNSIKSNSSCSLSINNFVVNSPNAINNRKLEKHSISTQNCLNINSNNNNNNISAYSNKHQNHTYQQNQQPKLNKPKNIIKNLIVHKDIKFLIIDFDTKTRELLEIWLRSEGFNFVSAKNRQDALSLISGEPIKNNNSNNSSNNNNKVNNYYDLIIYDTDTRIENIESLTHSQIFYIINKMEISQYQQQKSKPIEFQAKPVTKGNLLSHITYVLENRLKSDKLKEYEILVKEKEDEIQSLKSKVGQLKLDNEKIHKALEPPIEAITNSLNEILNDQSLSNSPIKRELENILYQITTNTDLYGPAVEKLMNQDINPIAKSILKTYYMNQNTSDNVQSNEIKSWGMETDIEPLMVWGFNPFLYTDDQLIGMLHSIFVYYKLPERLNVSEMKLNQFLNQVKIHYHNHAYHNFYHAFDVTQTLFTYLTTYGLAQYLTHLDIIALLLSGLCHDLNHPGLSNTFLINTFDSLAQQYNDRSVLENHHLHLMWKLLDQFNFLGSLTREEKKEFRSCAITAVISTDMSLHFPLLTRLKQRVTEIKLNPNKFLDNTLQDRIFLIELLLHAADISNISKPWEVSENWCNRINVESFIQGKLEIEKGIPVTDWMDETKTSVAKNSLNFMLYIGSTFYELISEMFPQTRVCFDHLKNNIIVWSKICDDSNKNNDSSE